MMILIVVPVWQDNAAHAENLLDLIYKQSGRLTRGHVLLAIAAGVHVEMRERLRISASLAFVGVHELEIRPLADAKLPKTAWVNSVFRQCAEHIKAIYHWPFLWLEPDTTPVRADWMVALERAYHSQPKGFFGTQMKVMTPEGKPPVFFMARCGVYPPSAIDDYPVTEFRAPYELAVAPKVIPRLTATKLIQQLAIHTEADLDKVRDDAILVHGDKQGLLLRKIAALGDVEPAGEPVKTTTTVTSPTAPPVAPRKRRHSMTLVEEPLTSEEPL